MSSFNRFIRKGKAFTGRNLVDALRIASKPPHVVGGLGLGGLNVRGSGADTVIENTRRHPIPKTVVIFPALISSSVSIATNRWRYFWDEAGLSGSGEYTLIKLGGRSWNDPENGGFGGAKNTAEQLNTASFAAHGVDLTPPDGGSVDVLPIPDSTPIMLFRDKHSDGFFRYNFNATNAINFTCAP